ncbi:MAG: 2-oxo acid dehydrogenase subunit E2, partial [Solirubrobacteraceae bacterium]
PEAVDVTPAAPVDERQPDPATLEVVAETPSETATETPVVSAEEIDPTVDEASAPSGSPEAVADTTPPAELPDAPEATPDAPMVDPDADALAAAAALAAETGADLADAGEGTIDVESVDVESELPGPEPTTPADEAADASEPSAPVSDDAAAETEVAGPAADAQPGEPAPTTPEAEPVPDAPPAAPTADPEAAPAPRGKGDPVIVELTRQQQTVARRMAESKATIPDFHTVMEIDAGPLVALRAELKANRPDLAAPSVGDWLLKATAVALRAFPSLNGGYRDGRIEQYPKVNVGFAVDRDGTLLVPVVHEADALAVGQIAARTRELIGKATDGSLRPPDIASATFTVANLGSFGVDQFTAVITPGQAGILTAGVIAERPVARDGAIVAAPTLRLTLTTDHRAVYGAEAARFLGRIRQLLEHPTSLLA